MHIIKPDVVRAAGIGLGEEQDRRRDSGIRPEGAIGQADDRVEFLLLDQDAAQFAMGITRSEEHAVRHNDGRPPPRLE